MNEEELEKAVDIENDFNVFIKKWCGPAYPHLIDSDENDGERIRDRLRILVDLAESVLKVEGLPEKKKCKNCGCAKFNEGYKETISCDKCGYVTFHSSDIIRNQAIEDCTLAVAKHYVRKDSLPKGKKGE